jgi:hypothetical protein
MDTLYINLENCFGIGKLHHEFTFKKSKSNSFLIYAPNGTMKTSFAHTLDLVSKNDPNDLPCDKVYSGRKTQYDILVDGKTVQPETILVVNAEDTTFDASSRISSFLASKELKQKYDNIYAELNSRKADFIKRLKSISQSTDCETELLAAFSQTPRDSFFDVLLSQFVNLSKDFIKPSFRYNDVFDKKGNVKKFLDKNEQLLDNYINSYKDILSNSRFFKPSSNNKPFGTYQANEILKSIDDNSYFEAGHKFVLEDGTEIYNSEQLKKLVQHEIESILKDATLKKSFEQIDKAIAANSELRAFQKVVEKDNSLLLMLSDYEKFKQIVWQSFLSEMLLDAEELTKLYSEKKKELEAIIAESKKEFELWRKIIKTFNSRFFVPFEVGLANQEDIILREERASLEFNYADRNDAPIKQTKDNLLNILSKGEQRAFFILQFLFEIESRKLNSITNLLVFDDVADSFDYKNKYAIIEYIQELHLSGLFRMIILTHNFDFYRTIASRLGIKRDAIFMASKTDLKEIVLHQGQYVRDVFKHFLTKFSEPKVFVTLISFVRNLIEYSEPDQSPDYLCLTSCLHLKPDSSSITANDIFNVYTKKITQLSGKTIPFANENIILLISKTAESICNESNVDEVLLENKVALAIAIRLKAEQYLINKLPNLDLTSITNQTRYLYNEYKLFFPGSSSLEVLDKVNLMTPENIHVNAFMYEPLIDMSVQHLINLYKETSHLN